MIKRGQPKKKPEEPSLNWRPGRVACVCTDELAHELEGWMTTAWHFLQTPLAVIGDYPTQAEARRIAKFYQIPCDAFPWLAGDGRQVAEERLQKVESHSEYWKEGVIWWKCFGLVRLLEVIYPGEGILFTDSDIVWIRRWKPKFLSDVVVSPFYWSKDMLHKDGEHIRKHHGAHNAGYIAIRHPDAAKQWLEWYEQGEGGFYEQGCLNLFDHQFDTDYFGREHNHGKWRKLPPTNETISIHFHQSEVPRNAYSMQIQVAADRARRHAIEALQPKEERVA